MSKAPPARRNRVCVTTRRREMIRALRKLARKHGPDISMRLFAQESGYPRPMIYDFFDNWADLRVQAGLPARINRHDVHATHSRESLIVALQELAAELGDRISKIQFKYHTGISDCPIYRVFGSWREFRLAAGLDPDPKPGMKSQYSREEIFEMLREQIQLQGQGITFDQFCAATGLSRGVIDRQGGWMNFRRALGLSPHGRRNRRPNLQNMLTNLADLQALVSDPDTYRQDLLTSHVAPEASDDSSNPTHPDTSDDS